MNIFEGTHIKLDLKRYPNQVFFFKEDICWMEYHWENGYLWCRYRDFWEVLETENRWEYAEVQAFIKKQVEERFKLKGVTLTINGISGSDYINSVSTFDLYILEPDGEVFGECFPLIRDFYTGLIAFFVKSPHAIQPRAEGLYCKYPNSPCPLHLVEQVRAIINYRRIIVHSSRVQCDADVPFQRDKITLDNPVKVYQLLIGIIEHLASRRVFGKKYCRTTSEWLRIENVRRNEWQNSAY